MKYVLVVVLLLSIPLPSRATDPITTSIVVGEAEKALVNVIDEARSAGDFLLIRTAQEMLFMLDAFKQTNLEIMNTTFDEIGEERRQFLQGIHNSTREIKEGLDDSIERSEGIVDQVYQMVQNITLDDYPLLFRYRGAIVAPYQSHSIRVRLQGTNFTERAAKLTVQDKVYLATTPTSQELQFNIPREDLIHTENDISYLPASFEVNYETGGFLGFFTDTEVAKYDIELILLPKNLGTIEVSYDKMGSQRKENVLADQWYGNGRSGCKGFGITPSNSNRRFDTSKSTVTRHSGNSRGNGKNIKIRDVGISMDICFSRGTFDKDNGYAHYNYRAVEYWFEQTRTPMNQSLRVSWKDDISENIGTKVENVVLKFTDFTGKTGIHTPSSNPSSKYGNIAFDDQGIIIFRPKVPEKFSIL